MAQPTVQQLDRGIYIIDHDFLGVPGVIASFLLAGEKYDDLTLIESGPTTTIEMLLAGVRAAGFEPEQIRQLAVTHIHLDHAGSAGVLLQRFPQMRLLVHRVGAPHMIEPAKLLASATRIYGEDMDRLWGEFAPVPAERVDVLDDQSTFRAGGRELTAYDTPGHATHHLAYFDPESGDLFTGDVGGVRLDRADYVRPPTVPPEFDREAWRDSVVRLRALRPRRVCPTHFGAFDDPNWHFDDLLLRLGNWTGWVEAKLEQGVDVATIKDELRRRGDAEIIAATGAADLLAPYEVATAYGMTVDGMARYFRKRAS